ncbi:MAG: hypothetical protein QOJ75_698 [Chloroflexota bacterium]|jgi:hypothetical protein|nr:hypothetical protein [Chloroflexota bacterium]
MNTALREGLVEIEAAIPMFASSGLDERAVAIGWIAADSYEYIAGLLGFRPELQMLVLSEVDWPSRTSAGSIWLSNLRLGTVWRIRP